MERYICIHGHFYQPPRENPWIEEVELQDSAYPYHDWNERITAECYAPNTASRILGADRKVMAIVNNYSRMSFNFGPTLLSWMERHSPETLEAIVEADRQSRERFSGHGAALAQIYNHMIMPLASERDRKTQLEWGLRDFVHRFGRDPEGVWLPETAVDTLTLEILAQAGIRFTVLAPRQAKSILMAGTEFAEVNGEIDPTRAYRCRLPSGRDLALFFYDGPISHALAFEKLLDSGETFAGRLTGAFKDDRQWAQLVHIATDGESYGHHHPMGDMALAYCLNSFEAGDGARLTVYGEYLAKHPPAMEVQLHENSSWSCVHGVERWKSDCGCNTGQSGWHQQWRAPLRRAMDSLRDALAPLYETEARKFFADPWAARDGYIEVLNDRSNESVDRFLARQAGRELPPEERIQAIKLLEMQRHAMLMYTSCGWFFDEVSGIETTQVLTYAARAMQLASEALHVDFEGRFLKELAQAPSNIPEFGNAAGVFERLIKPAALDLQRVGAHFAIAALFHETLEEIGIFCYRAETHGFQKQTAGAMSLSMGRTRIHSAITGEAKPLAFAAVHFGGHSVTCGVSDGADEAAFESLRNNIAEALPVGDVTRLVQLLEQFFGGRLYSLLHLFRDEQQQVMHRILRGPMEDVWTSLRRLLDQNYTSLNFLMEMGRPLPYALFLTAEALLNHDLRDLFRQPEPDLERLSALVAQIQRFRVPMDRQGLGRVVAEHVTALMDQLAETDSDANILVRILETLRRLEGLDLSLNLWRAQNRYFALAESRYPELHLRAGTGDAQAEEWVRAFDTLAERLAIGAI